MPGHPLANRSCRPLAVAKPPRTVLIACGALAREILALIEANDWHHLAVAAVPAALHNRPDRIPDAVREKIRKARAAGDRVLVMYGDCGTGGMLDRMLAEEGVERISGPHCYSMYAGEGVLEALGEHQPGTFYLTDYMVRQFESLIIKGLGLDRHPELRDAYFGNYTDLLYLAQTQDSALEARARSAAGELGLRYSYRYTGYGELPGFLGQTLRAEAPNG